MNTNKYNNDAAGMDRRTAELSLFQRLTPAESRRARAIAYRAALSVLG